MSVFASIFSDFNLPNPTTWFYFSLLLAVALFFKFTRLWSLRNWDVVTLFLLVPGLLLLQEASKPIPTVANPPSLDTPSFLSSTAADQSAMSSPTNNVGSEGATPNALARPRLVWFGYLWLLCGSAYFMARCLIDLAIIRRPALTPNLNLSGLAWLGAALFVCLVAVAVRKSPGTPGTVGKQSAAVVETQRQAEVLVKQSEVARNGEASVDIAFWVECVLATVCHLAIVIGLGFIGWRHFQDAHAGVAAATFYLLLPYTAYHVGQIHHVLPSALLVWTIAAYRQPTLAGVLLGLAAITGYFPALLVPAWFSFYWGRGAGRFLGALVLSTGLALIALGGILWLNGDLPDRIRSTMSLSDWQPWLQPNPKVTHGFWTGVHWASVYRLPVFIAYLTFVATTLFWPRPKNLAHLMALSAAVVIGIQFWFADQGGVYVLWYLPLLLLLVFRPNLSERMALQITPATDWLASLRGRLARMTKRILRLPEPLTRVQ